MNTKNYILFDEPYLRESLLPFTFIRPIAEIRVGILTIADKWRLRLQSSISYSTQWYLSSKFNLSLKEDNVFINGAICPTSSILNEIESLTIGEALYIDNVIIAYRCNSDSAEGFLKTFSTPTKKIFNGEITILKAPWDIFGLNSQEIRHDYQLITKGRKSADINDKHTSVYNPSQVFIEEGVNIKASILNAEAGPIYIGKNAEIKEGSMIRGPFAMGENSMLNLGTKMHGDSSIGPYCKVGGEVSNCVFLGFSSKVHDGFLGNSVIGEWCNIGADTNTSNLKNNYGSVKVWNYYQKQYLDSQKLFCGLMLGDHSKVGINTMFNTGTVVGVSCNIFGGGFPPKFIPSYSWGGSEGIETFKLEQAFEVAERAMARRNKSLDNIDRAILREVFEQEKMMRSLLIGDK